MKHPFYLTAVMLVLPAALAAQNNAGSTRLAVLSGLGLPSSPSAFTDVYNASFTLGGQLQYQVASRTALVGRVAYHRFAAGEEGARSFIDIPQQYITSFSLEGGNLNMLSFAGLVTQQLTPVESKSAFFITGGLGLYNINFQDATVNFTYSAPFAQGRETITVTSDGSESKFGINFGAGLEQTLSESLSLLLEGRYNIVFTEEENTNFLAFLAGLSFRLGAGK